MEKNYQPTIGLEIHVELKTASKMFCGCKNNPFDAPPNQYVCPVCLGLPGSLPVVNRAAVLETIKIGRALNCQIASLTKWDRKHYFYPDLPKNYQISQFDLPICQGGFLTLPALNSGKEMKIKLTRIHLEEDTGKLLHQSSEDGENFSLIDFNRAGVPLVELVTEPMIKSGWEARRFCEEYQLILRYLGVSRADMEKGEMRCEANISVSSGKQLGTKVEVKNLNSFRAIERAIDYEIRRQIAKLETGGQIIQETRGWNDAKQKTFRQRVKETSADYRYFPEPDLVPIQTKKLEKKITSLPELPNDRRRRYRAWGLAEREIEILIRRLPLQQYFEQIAQKAKDRRVLVNLLINQAADRRLAAQDLLVVADWLSEKKITRQVAQKMIKDLSAGGKLIDWKNKLRQGRKNKTEIQAIVQQVVKENHNIVDKIKSGKTTARAYLIGQVMRLTRGQADPKIVHKLLEQELQTK